MRHVFSHISQQSFLCAAISLKWREQDLDGDWKLLDEKNPVSMLGKEDRGMPGWHDD
jgi:hypothetical protein